jgi:tetratricopeptide (TPR) repeat protein
LYQAGKVEKAILDYNQAIHLDPTQADLYQMKAIALMSLPAINQTEENAHLLEAQNNLLTALELNPRDVKIYQNLAACYSQIGDLNASLESYKKLLELVSDTDHPWLLKKLSSLHFELGEYEQALLNCEKAIQLGCKEGEIYFIQGCCLFETNQIEQALQKYDLAIHAGYDDPKVYFQRAKAYFCLHQLDKALEDATYVLKTDTDNIECYKLRGLIFLSRHQDVEAYADFRMALRVSGNRCAHQ